MLQRVEERVPMLSPFTGTMRDVITKATGSSDAERLNPNLIVGEGEVSEMTESTNESCTTKRD